MKKLSLFLKSSFFKFKSRASNCLKNKYICLIFLAFALACASQKESTRIKETIQGESYTVLGNEEITTIENQASQPFENGILFLGFNISLDSASRNYELVLADKIVKMGIIKESRLNKIEINYGTNLCTLFDSKADTLYKIVVENPLIQDLEFVKEDGNLETKLVFQNKGYFMLRVPNNKNYNHISFDIISDDLLTERIGSIDLNLQ